MLQLELLTSQSFFLVFFIILLSTEYAFYDAFYGSKWSNFLGILLIFWPWVLKSAFASLVWHGRPNAIAKDFWRLAKSWPQSDWHLGRLRIFRLRWDVMFFFVPRLEKKDSERNLDQTILKEGSDQYSVNSEGRVSEHLESNTFAIPARKNLGNCLHYSPTLSHYSS